MDGRPVWLASYSLRDKGKIKATGRYSQQERKRAIGRLYGLLRDVGDESHTRVFRMNVTICLHKALTDEESLAIVPGWCFSGRGRDIAGGPIEILEESRPGAPSTRPCVSPSRGIIAPQRPDLWFPVDCGKCESCRARAAL